MLQENKGFRQVTYLTVALVADKKVSPDRKHDCKQDADNNQVN